MEKDEYILEADVKKELNKYLKSIGAWWYMPVKMKYGSKIIDYLVCHKGRFYGIETKRPGKEPTLYQSLVMSAIIASGGQAWKEDSTELETTRAILF
jgi:hypothetical protein